MRAVLIWVIALAACNKTSEKYCGVHPEDVRCGDRNDSGAQCGANVDCTTPGFGVCGPIGSCVQCDDDDHDACTATTPVCDKTSNACRGCAVDEECASGVCSDDGSCADPTMVAYVAPGGTGPDCTRDMPCADLVAAESTKKPHIHVEGTVTESGPALFTTDARTIHGAGATVQVMGSTTAIEIGNTGTVLSIRGLTFTSIAGPTSEDPMIYVSASGPRLELDGVTIAHGKYTAIDSQRNDIVVIHRSVFAFNEGGPAVTLSGGQYEVTNSLFVGNGADDSTTGGVVLNPVGSMQTFAFNTVADNNSFRNGGRSTGITCVTGDISNTIVTGNMVAGCDGDYILWNLGDSSPAHTPEGTGVIQDEPGFAETADLASPMFYRLGATSPAIDMADPAAALATDLDGEPRPANGRSDIGADERQ